MDELLDLFVRSIVVICEYQLAASIQIWQLKCNKEFQCNITAEVEWSMTGQIGRKSVRLNMTGKFFTIQKYFILSHVNKFELEQKNYAGIEILRE